MKIIILISLFIINTLTLIAQEKIVITYQYRLNEKSTDFKLYIDQKNQKSIYISQDTLREKKVEYKDGVIYIDEGISFIKTNYASKPDNVLISVEVIEQAGYLVTEPLPSFNWIVEDENKIIDGSTLRKATTTFRGKKFIAWFSERYPINIGPWKFNNLPGLAYIITEETNKFEWKLKKIEVADFEDTIFEIKNPKLVQSNLREFVKIKDKYVPSFVSKLPRDAKVTLPKKTRENLAQ